MTQEQTYTRLYGNLLRSTDKAVHFSIVAVDTRELDKPKEEWFPKSQLKSTRVDPTAQDEDMIEVADWILKQKELI